MRPTDCHTQNSGLTPAVFFRRCIRPGIGVITNYQDRTEAHRKYARCVCCWDKNNDDLFWMARTNMTTATPVRLQVRLITAADNAAIAQVIREVSAEHGLTADKGYT